MARQLTVADYAQPWLDGLANQARKATTLRGYRSVLRVHVLPVSERLGHSSVSFTLDTYAHVMPGQHAAAAEAAAALLRPT